MDQQWSPRVRIPVLLPSFIFLQRVGRVVEGTSLLRTHSGITGVEGSNPSLSASNGLRNRFYGNSIKEKIMRKHRKPISAPRNLDVPAMMLLKSGAHGKTEKAKRRADRMELHRDCSSRVEHPAFNRRARVQSSPVSPFQNSLYQAASEWPVSSVAEQGTPNALTVVRFHYRLPILLR